MKQLCTRPIIVLLAFSIFSHSASAQEDRNEERVFGGENSVKADFGECRSMARDDGDRGRAAMSCIEACAPVLQAARAETAVAPEVQAQCNVAFNKFKAALGPPTPQAVQATEPMPDVEGFLTHLNKKSGQARVESRDNQPWVASCGLNVVVKDSGDIPDVSDAGSQIVVRVVGIRVPVYTRRGMNRRMCTADRIELVNPRRSEP